MVASILCVGMAGSGKTTFMQRLNSDLHAKKTPPYILNLDPAVHDTPYGSNIDIRDSVNYHKVMEDYGLGPNGAITTSLNLFATKIDQVINLVEKRAEQVKHVLVDTPGQIEVFMWSASGQIITDAFASSFPTMIAYIVDTPRCTSPSTFMSNMLYACSILYKMKLPMIIVFNKADAQDPQFAKDWMTDFEAFQEALKLDDEEGGAGYMGSLMNSMSLMLEEFYNCLDVVGVSAMTGQGIDEFFEVVDKKVEEYNNDYKTERERVLKLRESRDADRRAKDLTNLLKDVGAAKTDPLDTVSDVEDDEDDSDGLLNEDDELEDVDEQGNSLQDRYSQALRSSNTEDEAAAIKRILTKE